MQMEMKCCIKIRCLIIQKNKNKMVNHLHIYYVSCMQMIYHYHVETNQ